jgi:hypothetical protein
MRLGAQQCDKRCIVEPQRALPSGTRNSEVPCGQWRRIQLPESLEGLVPTVASRDATETPRG